MAEGPPGVEGRRRDRGPAPWLVRWRRPGATYAAIFVLAAAVRFLVARASGGIGRVYLSYDAGVYYAAADALTFGRLPYRDFVLLHPPVLPIAVTPFAVLGRLTDDRMGFLVAVIAFIALGAVNAVLVVLVCTRMGLSRTAAALGGAFEAVWLGSAQAEYQIRLEPLGNLFVLLGLLAYLSSRRTGRRAPAVWAGVAFGMAASVKIWWAVPVLVLIGVHLWRDHRRNLLPVTAGAAICLVVVNLPFAIASHWAMWQMVVGDQVGRPESVASPVARAARVLGVRHLLPGASPGLVAVVVLIGAAMAAAAMAAAWRCRPARPVVALLVAQIALLAVTPPWFVYYPDYLAPAAALTVAAAVGGAATGWRGAGRGTARLAALRVVRAVPVLGLVGALAVTGRFLVTGTGAAPWRPSAELTAAASTVRCLMSDSPSGLIMLDALSRNLRDGCRNWVDVTGRTYGADKALRADGSPVPPADNAVWQRDLLRYLTSGDAVFLVRTRGAWIGAATRAELGRGPVLARSGPDVIHLTPHG